MKLNTLYREQKLKITLDAAWNFFSSPHNLKEITPPHMGFEITSGFYNEKMFAGMIVEYILRPLFGIPIKWVTEITHVKENEYFVDEQRFGPYKFWHHRHQFRIDNGELIMTDVVNYALPLGILGRIAHKLFIKKEIEKIFDYRAKILSEIFGK
jgi:ligand-binding SRPBCC domain-containing protein